MGNGSKTDLIHKNFLLDEAWSPVARFRLLSDGVNENALLVNVSQVRDDRACLACGNCVDACPVVKQNVGLVFQQNQRTSMSLENFVQEECRRCYRCVLSCPQVDKDLKEYAAGFRRVEKIVHLFAAFFIISLAATGVIQFHYENALHGYEANILKYAHRVIGVFSIVIPILYYKLDINHFRRSLKKVFRWNGSDLQWMKNTLSHIFLTKRNKNIFRNEFNPAQKFWYMFIMFIFPILYLSGLIAMIFGGPMEGATLIRTKTFHIAIALSFDIMLFVHVYVKFIREWIKTGVRIFRNYQDTKSFVYIKNK